MSQHAFENKSNSRLKTPILVTSQQYSQSSIIFSLSFQLPLKQFVFVSLPLFKAFCYKRYSKVMNTPKKPRVRKKRLDEFDSLASVDMVPQQSRFDSGEMPLGSSNDVTKSRSNLTAWLGQCPESHKIETIFNQRFAKRG